MDPLCFSIPGATVTQVDRLVESLPDGTRLGRQVEAAPGALLLRVASVGAYLVREGRSIEFTVEPGADPDAVELYLYGAARGALLHQRGELPLHASTLVPPHRSAAVALCGDSGMGKSTLATELRRRGWSFVADDMTRITWDGSNPLAWPSRQAVKLWGDACEGMGLETDSLRRVRQGLDKFYVPVSAEDARESEEPVRLGLVLELSFTEGGLEAVTQLPEKAAILSRQTFRAKQIGPLGMLPKHLRIVSQVASKVAVGRLCGARAHPVAQLADRAEEALAWAI